MLLELNKFHQFCIRLRILKSMMITYTNANNEIFTISLNHHRIVKEPGFDIIIHNVDELNFYQKNKNIYMKIIVDNKEHVYLIATDYQISENEKDEVETVL